MSTQWPWMPTCKPYTSRRALRHLSIPCARVTAPRAVSSPTQATATRAGRSKDAAGNCRHPVEPCPASITAWTCSAPHRPSAATPAWPRTILSSRPRSGCGSRRGTRHRVSRCASSRKTASTWRCPGRQAGRTNIPTRYRLHRVTHVRPRRSDALYRSGNSRPTGYRASRCCGPAAISTPPQSSSGSGTPRATSAWPTAGSPIPAHMSSSFPSAQTAGGAIPRCPSAGSFGTAARASSSSSTKAGPSRTFTTTGRRRMNSAT